MKKRCFRLDLVLFINMLVLKKKIILINIKTSTHKIIQTKFYYFMKNKLVFLISFSNCSTNKIFIVNKYLSYIYTIKWNCASPFILNSKLNGLIEFFYNIKNIGYKKTLSYLSYSKYFISIIRSPFVYKKSMEQLYFEKYLVTFKTTTLPYNFFFHDYQYTHLKLILKKKIILKLICKITFTFY